MSRVKCFSLAIGIAALAIATVPAHAQAPLTFTGGSGSPLTITLTAPVTYNLTGSSATASGPFFVFAGTGNIFSFNSVTGTITYSVNGGSARTITNIDSGFTGGVTTPNDAFIWNNTDSGVVNGDTVTLFAGTITTVGNIAAAAPTDGQYTTYIADGIGNNIGNGSVAAPEPGTLALLAVGAVGLVVRRRRQN